MPGNKLAADVVFAVPPPVEIGKLLSASSEVAMTGGAAVIFIAFFTMVGFLAGLYFGRSISPESEWLGVLKITLSAAAISAIPVLALYRYKRDFENYTMVGERGVAVLQCSKSQHRIAHSDLMPFESAAELRTTVVRITRNGSYSETTYDYQWSSEQGALLHRISGSFKSQDNTPPPSNRWYFATRAEAAWNAYLLPHVVAGLARDGWYQFNFRTGRGDNWVRVGRGWLELRQKGKTHRVTTQEMKDVTLVHGKFTMKRVDAHEGFLRSTGIFNFEYSDLANATLFRVVYDQFFHTA